MTLPDDTCTPKQTPHISAHNAIVYNNYICMVVIIVCQCISYSNTALKLVLILLLIYHAYTIKYDS